MTALDETQWQLDGYTFGAGTDLIVEEFELGDPAVEYGDTSLPGRDGTVFGTDYDTGRTLVFTIHTSPELGTAVQARAAVQELEQRWRSPVVRLTPRAMMPLRMRLAGGPSVVVYGRPRRFDVAVSSLRAAGYVSLISEFRCVDSLFYSDDDAEHAISLTMIAPGVLGLGWPFTWPIAWAAGGERQDTVTVSGSAATWPVVDISGPVAQPEITLVDQALTLRLDTTLAETDTVTIDTRPWERTVTRQDGASLAGSLRGAALSDFALPLGSTLLHYGGTDLSGQSTCTVRWRDAYTTA